MLQKGVNPLDWFHVCWLILGGHSSLGRENGVSRSMQEGGIGITLSWEPTDHSQKLSIGFSEPSPQGCASCTKHAKRGLTGNHATGYLTHWCLWSSLFWESFWHKVDSCRSVTCSQGEDWIPFLSTCPLRAEHSIANTLPRRACCAAGL